MRNNSEARHLRLAKDRTPMLKEYFSIGSSFNKATSKTNKKVLDAWAKLPPQEHHHHSDLVNLWTNPKSFSNANAKSRSQNLPNFKQEVEVKPMIKSLNKSVRSLNKGLSQMKNKQQSTRIKRINTTGKIKTASSISPEKKPPMGILNNPMESANYERIRSQFVLDHLSGFIKSRAKSKDIPKKETMLDRDNYYIIEEPHLDCQCDLVDIQYQNALMINKRNWNNLLIGCIRAANNFYYLKKHRVTAIVSIGKNLPHKFTFVSDGYLHITQDIFGSFAKADAFMSHILKKGNLLVTCYSANDRSCSLIAGFLIKTFGCSIEVVLNILRNARPGMNISVENLNKLKRLEARYSGKV